MALSQKEVEDVILRAVNRGISETRQLLALCELKDPEMTFKRFRGIITGMVDDKRISRGMRGSRVKNRPFAYVYLPYQAPPPMTAAEREAAFEAKLEELAAKAQVRP